MKNQKPSSYQQQQQQQVQTPRSQTQTPPPQQTSTSTSTGVTTPTQQQQQSQQTSTTPTQQQYINFTLPTINQTIISNIKLYTTSFESLLLSLSSTDQREQIKSIIYFSSQLINNKSNGIDLVYCIQKQLAITQQNHIKVLLINLLGDISLDPFIESLPILNKLLNIIKNEKSKKVLSSCLININKINKSLNITNSLISQIIESIEPLLHCTSPLVRRETIVLLGSIVKNLDRESEEIQILLLNYLKDTDYRVREASLKSLSIIFQRGASLSVNKLYQSIILLLLDSFEQVRLECIKLIWIFGNIYPNHIVVSGGKKIRLVDDVFKKICNAVNDSSVTVRNCACKLLGCTYDVSLHYLIQTLSKEVMVWGKGKQYQIGHSSITKQKLQQKQQQQASTTGSTSSTTTPTIGNDGQPTHIITPEGDIDVVGSDSLNILESGVIGAFIQGLEDEFYEVRSSAIDSMCELSVRNDEFAQKNIDFLVDIFNDEIESVRINSINSLRKIGNNVVIKEEQLHIILANLESSSKEERQSLHRLLSSIHLSNYSCLHATTQALLMNLSRYPYDFHSIFDTLKIIGQTNPFTEFIVDDLLRIDPRFASVEPNMDDIFYVAVMVLVLNACIKNHNILSLLPSFCFQHHLYFKDKYPKYFPQNLRKEQQLPPLPPPPTPTPSSTSSSSQISSFTGTNIEINEFLNSTLSLLCNDENGFQALALNQKKENQLNKLFQECKRNLKRVSSICLPLKATSDFYKKYLDILTIIISTNREIKNNGISSCIDSNNGASTIPNQINHLVNQLKFKFIGIDNTCNLILLEILIYSIIIEILSNIILNNGTINNSSNSNDNSSSSISSSNSNSSSSSISIDSLSNDQINQIKSKLIEYSIFSNEYSCKISNSMKSLLILFKLIKDDGQGDEEGERPNKIQKLEITDDTGLGCLIYYNLIDWIDNYIPPMLKINNLIKKKSVDILSPNIGTSENSSSNSSSSGSNKPIEFLDIYPLKLTINAKIENIRNLDSLLIQSSYQSIHTGIINSQFHTIPKSSFTPTKPLSYNISCSIYLSLPNIRQNRLTSKESIPIKISIVQQQNNNNNSTTITIPLSKFVIFNILPVDNVNLLPNLI